MLKERVKNAWKKFTSFLKNRLMGMLIFTVITGLLTTYLYDNGKLIFETRPAEYEVFEQAIANPELQFTALIALEKLGRADEKLIKKVSTLVTTSTGKLKGQAFFTLAQIDPSNPLLPTLLSQILRINNDFNDIWLNKQRSPLIDSNSQRHNVLADLKSDYRILQLSDLIKFLAIDASKIKQSLLSLSSHSESIVKLSAALALIDLNVHVQQSQQAILETSLKLAAYKNKNWLLFEYSLSALAEHYPAAEEMTYTLLKSVAESTSGYSGDELNIFIRSMQRLDPTGKAATPRIIDQIKLGNDLSLFEKAYVKAIGSYIAQDLGNIINQPNVHPQVTYLTFNVLRHIGSRSQPALSSILTFINSKLDNGEYYSTELNQALGVIGAIQPEATDVIRPIYNILQATEMSPNSRASATLLRLKNIYNVSVYHDIKGLLLQKFENINNRKGHSGLNLSMNLIKLMGKDAPKEALEIFATWILANKEQRRSLDYSQNSYWIEDILPNVILALDDVGADLAADIINKYIAREGIEAEVRNSALIALQSFGKLSEKQSNAILSMAEQLNYFCYQLPFSSCTSDSSYPYHKYYELLTSVFLKHPALLQKLKQTTPRDFDDNELEYSGLFFITYLVSEQLKFTYQALADAAANKQHTYKNRLTMLKLLAELGYSSTQSMPDIIRSILSHNIKTWEVEDLTQALVKICQSNPHSIEHLLMSEIEVERYVAARTLAAIGLPSKETLVLLLNAWEVENNHSTQKQLLVAIGELG